MSLVSAMCQITAEGLRGLFSLAYNPIWVNEASYGIGYPNLFHEREDKLFGYTYRTHSRQGSLGC